MLKAGLLTLLGWLGLAHALAAAEPAVLRGLPHLQRFAPSDYGGSRSNSDLLATDDGWLYLANRRGLLRFDGSRWSTLRMPGLGTANALAEGPDGTVYVGGIDSFGRLQLGADGEPSYQELSAGFSSGDKPPSFGVVWSILSTSRGIWFRTDAGLLLLGVDGERLRWRLGDDVRRMFAAGDQLYARIDQLGLARWDSGEWRLLEGGSAFANVGIAAIIDHQDRPLVVADDGFHRLDGERVRRVEAADHASMSQYSPNTASSLTNGGLLVGAESGELLQFDAGLQLQAVHPAGRHAITQLDLDREGGTWLASESLLARVQLPSRWSSYSESQGLSGEVYDSLYRAGALWVATSEGLFRGLLEQHRVRFERQVEGVVFDLLDDPSGLLWVDNQGVMLAQDGTTTPRRLLEDASTYALQRSKFQPDQLFVYALEQILVGRLQSGQWQQRIRWPLDGADVSTLIEHAPDQIWVNDLRGGPQQWTIDPVSARITDLKVFGEGDGMHVDLSYGSALHSYAGELYAVSGKTVFRWENNRFRTLTVAPFSLVEEPFSLGIVETPLGDFAFDDRRLFHRPADALEWQRLALNDASAQGFGQVELHADGQLRLISWGGVLQFDPGVAEAPLPPLQVQLRRARRENAAGVVTNLLATAAHGIRLPADEVLRLEFGMGSLESPSEVRYRVRGLINSWSPWTAGDSQLTLRYPGAGQFTLEVHGRTQSGREAKPLQLAISAPPRWWQTPAALVVALMLASLATLVLSRTFQRYRSQRDEAMQAAHSDPLTGVLNRRAAQTRLRQLAQQSRTRQVTFAVLFVDLDRFKSINDRYGHAAGDQCLKVVAERVRRELRGGDALARWGGEEFLVLLDGAAAADAHRIAERIRQRVADGVLEIDSHRVQVTVSIGVAVYHAGEDSIDSLVSRADEALYQAKSAGRDRVMPSLEVLTA